MQSLWSGNHAGVPREECVRQTNTSRDKSAIAGARVDIVWRLNSPEQFMSGSDVDAQKQIQFYSSEMETVMIDDELLRLIAATSKLDRQLNLQLLET